ncbi:Alpha/Beta hydrolase protein [Flagelloscypha sp. PMI_526]|nr:Alpha/Beta hydrolase protein [Flagelloscypha sp. PMI_526]
MSSSKIVYSHLQGIPLEFELWLPISTVSSKPLPVVIFFHGGGLVSGGKNDRLFAAWLRDLSVERGFAFIAADYPLLHPLTYKDIIDQTKELFNSVSPLQVSQQEGMSPVLRLFTLSLNRSRSYRHLEWEGTSSMIHGSMGTNFTLAQFLVGLFSTTVRKPCVDSPVFFDLERAAFTDAQGRWDACLWLMVNGLFLDYLTGVQGVSKQLSELTTEVERYTKVTELGLAEAFPEIYLNEAPNAAKFPPSFIYHGGADPLIFPGESEKTFATLKNAGVETELAVVPGAVHAMIDPATSQYKEGVAELQVRAFEFISKELTR